MSADVTVPVGALGRAASRRATSTVTDAGAVGTQPLGSSTAFRCITG